MKLKFSVALILLLQILLFSCKKSSDDATSSKPLLMTIHVSDHYFHPVLGGVIYISGEDGKTMAEMFCPGAGDYRFYGGEGTTLPQWLEVTVVRIEPYWHSFNILAETYTRIRPSEWTLSGNRHDTIGSVDPVFVHVPEHKGSILISSSGYSNLTFTPGLIPIPLYKSPDDLLFMIPTLTGYRYQWAPVTAGSKDTIDLSQTLVPQKSVVSLGSVPVSFYECRIDGYPDSVSGNNLPFRIVEMLGTENPGGKLEVSYPPGKFNWFHTTLSVVDDWISGKEYYYQVNGAIPSEFKRNTATLVDHHSENYWLTLHATGNADAVCGLWVYQSPYEGMVEWRVYGPDTTTRLAIPEIAPVLNSEFPWMMRDSLSYRQAELMDATRYQGYLEMLNGIYNPANPSGFDALEITKLLISN